MAMAEAAIVAVGDRVSPGPDWKGDADAIGGRSCQGTVTRLQKYGAGLGDSAGRFDAVEVRWPNGKTAVYRWGHTSQYEVKLVKRMVWFLVGFA
jgi:hypothetical protein